MEAWGREGSLYESGQWLILYKEIGLQKISAQPGSAFAALPRAEWMEAPSWRPSRKRQRPERVGNSERAAAGHLAGSCRAFPVCMPAAEAKEGAAEPAANAGDAMDGPQSLSEIVAAMERRLQAEISIATV